MNDNQWQAGLDALAAGHRREARRLFRAVVHDRPNDPEAWWRLALATDDLEQRIQCIQQTLRLQPDRVEARQLLAAAKRQAAKLTPVGGIHRPIVDTRPEGTQLEVDPGHVSESPSAKLRSARKQPGALAAIGLVGLVIALGALAIIAGIIARRLSLLPTSMPTSPAGLALSVEGCVSAADGASQLVFVNQTSLTIGVTKGPVGNEEFLAVLSPNEQVALDVVANQPTRYAAQSDLPGVVGGGAVIEIPVGSVCTVQIR